MLYIHASPKIPSTSTVKFQPRDPIYAGRSHRYANVLLPSRRLCGSKSFPRTFQNRILITNQLTFFQTILPGHSILLSCCVFLLLCKILRFFLSIYRVKLKSKLLSLIIHPNPYFPKPVTPQGYFYPASRHLIFG